MDRCWNYGQTITLFDFLRIEWIHSILRKPNGSFVSLRLLSTKIRCLRETSSFVRYFYRNNGKIYVIVKFISIFLTVFVYAGAQGSLTDGVYLTKLPAFASPRIFKQIGLYHLADNRLTKSLRLFRCSYLFLGNLFWSWTIETFRVLFRSMTSHETDL